MSIVKTELSVPVRSRLLRVYLHQGVVGLAMAILVTWLRIDEVSAIWDRLGPQAPLLVGLLVIFALALSLLKFPLANEVFISPGVVAYIAILPLLGLVLSTWIAIFAAVLSRSIAMAGIGPTTIAMHDRDLELARLFGLFGTYGIPMVGAGWVYQALGGATPQREASIEFCLLMAVSLLVFMMLNMGVMYRMQRALGYSHLTCAKIGLVDTGLNILALPYVILVPFSWAALGLGGLLLAVYTGVAGTIAVRNLAAASSAEKRLISRLASLSNVAAAISLDLSREQLLHRIWTECGKVMDVSLFAIAVLDEEKQEFRFEFEICDGKRLPVTHLELGSGLNSWVVENRRSLLIRSLKEEAMLGLSSVEDQVASESWLGVPMIVQDRIIGVISVQSYQRSAFSDDDVVLMMAMASQAAAIIEDSNLFHNLESLNVELESRVTERTNDLRQSNLQLRAADQAKNRFLAHMSHELRTPLNSIIGFSGVIRSKAQDDLSPQLLHFVENIHDSGKHLLELINDLLDLSKIEAGKVDLQISTFEPREAVAAVVRLMKGVAADSEVSIEPVISSDLPAVRMDEVRFKQILVNLLSNAVKFSHKGEAVTIEVSRLEAKDSALSCPTLRMVVEDRGEGIPASELEMIFEDFYRAEGAGLQKTGTGLGLALTRRFVELHRGAIEVESELGVGTRFVVDLPCSPDLDTTGSGQKTALPPTSSP